MPQRKRRRDEDDDDYEDKDEDEDEDEDEDDDEDEDENEDEDDEERPPYIENYLGLTLFCVMFCGWPAGMIPKLIAALGLMASLNAKAAYNAGNYREAYAKAAEAKGFAGNSMKIAAFLFPLVLLFALTQGYIHYATGQKEK